MSFSVSVVHPAASSNTMGTGQNYLPSQHCGPSCRFHKQIRRKKGQKRFPAASNTGCQNRRNKREEKKDPEEKKKKKTHSFNNHGSSCSLCHQNWDSNSNQRKQRWRHFIAKSLARQSNDHNTQQAVDWTNLHCTLKQQVKENNTWTEMKRERV